MKQALVLALLLSTTLSLSSQTIPHYFIRVHDDYVVAGGKYAYKGDKLLRPDGYGDSIDLASFSESFRLDAKGGRVLVYIHGFSAGDLWYERYMAKQLQEQVLSGEETPFSVILNVMYDTHSAYGKEKEEIEARAQRLAPYVADILQFTDAEVSILAHSMGNRVLLNFLSTWYSQALGLGINHVVFAAPDLSTEVFFRHSEMLESMADTIAIFRHDVDRVLGFARSTDDIDRLGLNLPVAWEDWPSSAVVLDGSSIKRQKTLYDNMSNHRYHIMSEPGVEVLRYFLEIDSTIACPPKLVPEQPRYIICQD